MKDKKTQLANINKIPNENLFVEYYRQMQERFPEFYPRIEICYRRYSGKIWHCLRFFIVGDDNYDKEFVMYAWHEPKNGKINCTLDFIGCNTIQEEVDFEESSDVRKMNIRNVILEACYFLEQYGSSETAKALEERVKNG